MHILLAEQDDISRRRLLRFLQNRGHRVEAVANGVSAWKKFHEDSFDIIIAGWSLQQMSGQELISGIRKEARKHYCYIIIMIIQQAYQDAIIGLNCGADDFISKPLELDELNAKVEAGRRIVELERQLSRQNRELEITNDKMRADLQAAATIQRSLLPAQKPDLKGVSVDWHFSPCAELAGDSLNILRLDEQHLAFYMIDVSGHGVSAALLAFAVDRMLSPVMDDSAMLKTRISDPPYYRLRSPAEVCTLLNRRFPLDINTGQYFTLIYGILNTTTGIVNYSSAGHTNLLLLPAKGQPRFIDAGDLPIGFMPDCEYHITSLQMTRGDRLVLYSDGVSECANADGKHLGEDGILRAISASDKPDDQPVLQRIIEAEQKWRATESPTDDISLLTICLGARGPAE